MSFDKLKYLQRRTHSIERRISPHSLGVILFRIFVMENNGEFSLSQFAEETLEKSEGENSIESSMTLPADLEVENRASR